MTTRSWCEAAAENFAFPCDFPLKVVGHHADDFEVLVAELVRRHVPDLADDAIRRRESGKGTYLSLTVTVRAESREQLDNLYRELSAHERVLMAL